MAASASNQVAVVSDARWRQLLQGIVKCNQMYALACAAPGYRRAAAVEKCQNSKNSQNSQNSLVAKVWAHGPLSVAPEQPNRFSTFSSAQPPAPVGATLRAFASGPSITPRPSSDCHHCTSATGCSVQANPRYRLHARQAKPPPWYNLAITPIPIQHGAPFGPISRCPHNTYLACAFQQRIKG